MENASKALVMAGGILISLLIISVVALTYENIASLERQKASSEEVEQATVFNKKFDTFVREGLYGSEIISAANLAIDYNKTSAVDDGYDEIEIEVIFDTSKPIDSAKHIKIDNSHYTYNLEEIVDAYNGLEKDVSDCLRPKYATGKTIDYYISIRTQELNKLIDDYGEGTGSNNVPTETLRREYQYLKAEQTQFKRKKFDCTAEYSNVTGRIKKLTFEEK